MSSRATMDGLRQIPRPTLTNVEQKLLSIINIWFFQTESQHIDVHMKQHIQPKVENPITWTETPNSLTSSSFGL